MPRAKISAGLRPGEGVEAELEPAPPAPRAGRTYTVSPAVMESRKAAGERLKQKRAAEAAEREEEKRMMRETIEILRELSARKKEKAAKAVKPAAEVKVEPQHALPPAPNAPTTEGGSAPVIREKAPTTEAPAILAPEPREHGLLYSSDEEGGTTRAVSSRRNGVRRRPYQR